MNTVVTVLGDNRPAALQDVTKWNGDHALNGNNKEWSEEDAAQHAFTLQEWRNRILDTQIEREKRQFYLMHQACE